MKQQIIALRRTLVGITFAGALAASMVAGWAWATMPLWLRVCSGIAGVGVLAANYIYCEVSRPRSKP